MVDKLLPSLVVAVICALPTDIPTTFPVLSTDSKEQLKKEITLKVVYYPNNSKITRYETKSIKPEKTTSLICNSIRYFR